MARLTGDEKRERHRLEGAVLDTKHALKGAKEAFVDAAKAYAAHGKSDARQAVTSTICAMEEAWDDAGSAGLTLEVFDNAVEARHAAAKAPKEVVKSAGASTGASSEE